MKIKKNKAQIWVETALYTLIGLTIIALLLSVAMPQIQSIKDRAILSQTINALNVIDNKILEVEQSQGSIGIINLKLSKGKMEIDPQKESIIYVLEESRLEFSEVGEDIKEGNIIIRTEEYGSRYNIFLILNYTNELNLSNSGEIDKRVFYGGSSPYKIKIENIPVDQPTEFINIDFDLF